MKPSPTPQIPIEVGHQQSLEPVRNWPKSVHVFDDASIWAINAALATGLPLLVRGEPGTGKSQLARAVAEVLQWPFLSCVVNARVEPEDLLYRFDAVARLATAQVLAKSAELAQLAPGNFLLPQILWWAFNSKTAATQHDIASEHCGDPGGGYGEGHNRFPKTEQNGYVVLIDEIDKADSEVPNSLLEALSIGGFQLPYGGGTIQHDGGLQPLIVVTTNEDRELPPAFIRRCFVLQIDLPEDDQDKLKTFLYDRVRAHFPDEAALSESVCHAAIDQLIEDRTLRREQHLPPPGLAELIDVLDALKEMRKNEKTQLEALAHIRKLAFAKHREEQL